MSVLARELDSYQRAVDAYQRRMNRYNRGVDAYRNTLVRDGAGNLLVVDGAGNVSAVDPSGRVIGAALPSGFNVQDYGMTGIPDTSAFRQLRQNPTSVGRETLTGVKKYEDSETGESYYYTEVDEGESGIRWDRLSSEWRLDKTIPGFTSGDDNWTPTTYEFSRDASTYLEAPAEWANKFRRRAPDPTAAQVRRAGMPSMAQIEGGLIGEVMRGGGVRQGVPAYRPRNK